jgi:CRISPR system Cascade subunit CasE
MPASVLVDHARTFGDPALVHAVGDLGAIASRPVPELSAGRILGFALRACPVARLNRGVNGHRRGAELDIFLVRCFGAGTEASVARDDVYRGWLHARLNPQRAGVELGVTRIAAVARGRLVRKTQGPDRRIGRIERPDVRFDGTITVMDPELFRQVLRRGIGRHRAFGFGALMLIPPGSTYPR